MVQKFASEEAITTMLSVSHPRRALNALIFKDVELLDAPIGDASCHARTVPVNDGCDLIHGRLEKNGMLDHAIDQVKAYVTLHAKDKADTKVKEASDYINGGLGSEEYEALFKELVDLFTGDHWELLCYCYSKTVDSAKSYTVWRTYYSRRSGPLYFHTNEVVEASGKASDRTNLDDELKAKLGQGNVDYLSYAMNRQRLVGTLQDDALRALTNPENQAIINLRGGKSYKVGEVFALFFTQLSQDYYYGREILVSVRHLSIDESDENDKVTWNGTAILMFTPNPNGGWDYIPDDQVTEKQKNRVVTYYNMWHTSKKGSTGTGLYSDNFEEFVEELKLTNFAWRALVYGSVHPPFTGATGVTELFNQAELIELSRTARDRHTFDERDCEGLRFDVQVPGDNHISLTELWACAHLAGQPIEDGHEYDNVPEVSNARAFTNSSYPLAINHVQSQTFARVTAIRTEAWKKYVDAACPALGRFLFRYGTGAIYCKDVVEAKAVDQMKPGALKHDSIYRWKIKAAVLRVPDGRGSRSMSQVTLGSRSR